MLLRGTAALAEAAQTGRALPGFVAYNLETVQAIVNAAERTGRPVLLQAGSSAFRHAGRDLLAQLAVSAAAASTAEIGVHLDHSRDLDEITACIEAGYTSAMVDGSHLSFSDNIALTRTAVQRAHDAGAWVEAELGAIAGDEDVSTDARAGAMTDPQQAAEFVAATGVDALAVAVGNVHGFTDCPVALDLDRLAAIHEATRSRWSCTAPAACPPSSSSARWTEAWPRSTSTPSSGARTSSPSPIGCPPPSRVPMPSAPGARRAAPSPTPPSARSTCSPQNGERQMPETSAARVAVIGLGAMGLPMATHLVPEFPVTAFDIDAGRRAQLVAAGATDATTPAKAAEGADIVLLAVRDQQQVESALFGENGVTDALAPGAVVILTSTVGPDAARATAGRLAEFDAHLVDAPVSGGPARAGAGDLLIVVSGAESSLNTVRPVLDRLASTLTEIGREPGDAQALKAINQLLAGVHIAAAAEAVAMARALGLDPGTVIDALSKGAAGSFMLADRGPRMIEAYGDGAEVRSRLDIFVKDMGIVADIAKQAHVPTPLASAAQQLYLLGERAGLASSDDSSVVTLLSPKEAQR